MDDEFARNMEDDYTLYNRSRHRFSVNRVSLEHLKHNPFPDTFSRVKGTHPHRYVLSAPTAVPLGELPTIRNAHTRQNPDSGVSISASIPRLNFRNSLRTKTVSYCLFLSSLHKHF